MKRIGVGALEITDSDKRAVMAVLDSNQLSPGPKVKEFEQAFAKSHGAPFGLFVNSGTDALRIALAALKEAEGWPDGQQVIVPALTFVATANVVLQLNLKPLFVDISAFDFNLDRHLFWKACRTNDLVAAIPVHLFGQPCRMAGRSYPFSVMETARERGLKVIEDSCECMGVSKVAGDIACYSTYVCHLISTGVGGLAITKNPRYAEIMRSLANHGRNLDGMEGDLEARFKFDRSGYSCRPTEIEAVLGLAQLKRLQDVIKRRRVIAKTFNEAWGAYPDLVLPFFEPQDPHAFMMYPIVLREGSDIDKWDFCHFLEKAGIETREMLPLINQPCYKHLNIDASQFPVADWVNRNGFYIGCHQTMSEDDVGYVIETFRRFLDGREKVEKRKKTARLPRPSRKLKDHESQGNRLDAAA